MNERQAHAFIHFGLGRRGEEPVPNDPAGWLAAQLEKPDPLLAADGPDTATAFATIDDYVPPREPPRAAKWREIGELLRLDQSQAMSHAILTDMPFRERLVWFWSNHFCVSTRRGAWVLALIGAHIREAIRPHVTGRFGDMLRAVMHHVAMLDYLDNLWSAGPDSAFGLSRHAGLNENLARECLELHTLGVHGGYTQADVTALAMMLTGWTASRPGDANPGFRFDVARHQPGPKSLMGMSFPEGLAGGEMALMWLACHPATHHHIATKLARHFIGDDPPEDEVARIARVLDETGGDLKAASLAVLDMPAAWRPLTKRRTPIEFVVAAYRALEIPPDTRPSPNVVAHELGQPLWGAPLPNGWPDIEAPWASGEAVLRRADFALDMADQAGDIDPVRAGEAALGDLLTARTRDAVRMCDSPREAVAMLLASPEFQRR
jgi:uncharacterized protein (DUF1800 family)